ncbi:MAG: hypothetical protein JJU36_11685 [Phycisphaeraceae bacterium]|nr:hypothetical protein [Phycisphaeraceae bacterium]
MSDRTPTTGQDRLSRWPRRLGIGVVVLIVVSIIGFAGFRLTADGMLGSAMRSVATAGHPTNVGELLARYRAPRDGVNAVETYAAAFILIQEPRDMIWERVPLPEALRDHPRWSHHAMNGTRPGDGDRTAEVPLLAFLPYMELGGLDRLGHGDPWPELSIQAMRHYLAVHDEAISLVLEAVEADYYHPPRDYHLGAVLLFTPDLLPMRRIATLLSMKLDLALLDGRVDEAIDLLEAMLRHAAMLDDELTLIGQLTRTANYAVAMGKIESILNLGPMNEARLARLESMVGQSSAVPDPRLLIVGEMVLSDQALLMLREHYGGFAHAMSAWSGHLSINRAYLMRWNKKALDILDRPIEEWTDHVPISPPPKMLQQHVLHYSRILLPAYENFVINQCRAEGLRRSMMAALAVERFRLAEGRPPDSLDDLVPGYLAALPVNPYPTPVEYQTFEDGYIVGFRRRGMAATDPLIERTEHGRWRAHDMIKVQSILVSGPDQLRGDR